MESLKDQLSGAGFDVTRLQVLKDFADRPSYRFEYLGGDAAIRAWHRLRQMVPQTNYWPVLAGAIKEFQFRESLEELSSESVREALAHAQEIDGSAWFEKRRQERLNEFEELNEGENSSDYLAKEGEWPDDDVPSRSFITPFDILTRKPHERIVVALLPTVNPWEVPAYLGFGGWNECPEAAEHCAILKYWFDRYEAEIACATNDVIECAVNRPPLSREKATALAHEQYIYCADIVEQGTETISNLAASILGGSTWFFWWD